MILVQTQYCPQNHPCPSLRVCPTGALQKPDPEAPVTTRPELCIGCKSCLLVCPFGVISLSAEGKAVIKCDLCWERLEQGQQPACVDACPTRALRLQDVEEIAAARRSQAAREIAVAVAARGESLRRGLRWLGASGEGQ